MGNKASKSTGNKKKSKISAQFTAFLVGIAGSGKTTFCMFIYNKKKKISNIISQADEIYLSKRFF